MHSSDSSEAAAEHPSATPVSARPVALITGGSRGIGLATAELLARRGHNIVLTARKADDLSAAADAVRRHGADVCDVKADLAQQSDLKYPLDCISRRYGRLDVLINNAGGSHHVRGFESLHEADWDLTLFQNLTAPARVTRAALPLLRSSERGAIVNVASKAGRHRTDMAACDYVAAKAGLIGFTRQLAQELGPAGIRVNAVAPGITVTGRVQERWQQRPEAIRQQVLAGIPLGRLAVAEEVAAAIAFLASEEASYITGACLDVNGGAFMG